MERKLGCQPFGATADQRIETLKLLKEAGFTNYFFGINNFRKQDAEKIMAAGEKLGLELEEIHAPFKDINRIWYDDEHGEEPFRMMMDSLEFCAEHKVPVMVIHESAGRVAPNMSNAALRRFRTLFETANEKGVKIAVENVRRTNYIARIFHENRDIPVYYCWDSGHELCYTPGVNHVALFPEKLICTHIHDNMGIYMNDDHILPFDGNTDWKKKAECIKASGYKGSLTLEINRDAPQYTDMTDEQYVRLAYERLYRFAEMCE